jgi:hypothetical protein
MMPGPLQRSDGETNFGVTSLAAPVCRPLLAIAMRGRPLPRSAAGAIVRIMATRRSAQTIPDLFSAPPTAKAAEPLAAPQNKANTGSVASQPRLFLPKDLAGALKRLDTAEIDALLAAVTTEAERRGRRAKDKPTAHARPQPRQASANHGAGSLTTGKLCARRFQSWRQAFGDRAAVRDFTVRGQEGARHRGPGPKI